MAPDLIIVGSFPKLQRVQQYNSLYLHYDNFEVWYTRKMPYGRSWRELPSIQHPHILFKEFRIYRHIYINFGIFLSCLAWLKSRPKKLILAQYSTITSMVILFFACILKIPVILWTERPGLSSSFISSSNRQFNNFVRQFIFYLFSFCNLSILPVGQLAKQSYQKTFPTARILPIYPLPISIDDYSDSKQYCTDYLSRPVSFIFAGSLTYRKGFHFVLEAVRLLEVTHSGLFQVHIYGNGPLLSSLQSHNLFGTCLIYHGFLELSEIPNAYKNKDIAICASLHDGWGNNVVEALASGTPVIGSPFADAAYTLLDSSNGILLDYLSPESISSAMSKYIDQRSLIQEQSMNSLDSVAFLDHSVSIITFLEILSSID